MFDVFIGLANEAKVLVIAVAGVVWLGATLALGILRRSFLAALGWFVAGAFLMWMMVNSDWVRDRGGDDIQQFGAPAVAEVEASWTSTSS
jgi:hypothetical protein